MKLKPCPFCGSTDVQYYKNDYDAYGGDSSHFLVCQGCEVEGPWLYTKEAVIKHWNTRANEAKES